MKKKDFFILLGLFSIAVLLFFVSPIIADIAEAYNSKFSLKEIIGGLAFGSIDDKILTYYAKGEYEEAHNVLFSVKSFCNDVWPSWHHFMGYTLLNMGPKYWEQAYVEYNKAIELFEKRVIKTGNESNLLFVESLQRQKNYMRSEGFEQEWYQRQSLKNNVKLEKTFIPKIYEQRRIIRTLNKTIKKIDDVDDVDTRIVWSENRISASVLIIPKPESDIFNNRIKIENITNILTNTINDLNDENIVIVDQNGCIYNIFD